MNGRRGRQQEWVLWVIPIAMVLIASFLIASTQRQTNYAIWHHHLITAGIGIIIAIALKNLSLEKLKPLLIPLYVLTLVSLIAVKIIGTTANGAQRWINLGGLHIQPSEFAKVSIILVLAAVLAKHPVQRPVDLLRPIGVISLPWFLIFIQPDLGTSLVFGALMLTMLYWSGMPIEWALLLLSPFFTALISGLMPWIMTIMWIPLIALLAYRALPWKKLAAFITIIIHSILAIFTPWLWINGLKDYQRDRLTLFLDPSQDPLGGGYHLLQSTVGIGSGGWVGTGLLQGQLTKLRFIPEQHTDFIFSALGEETGFIGCLLVILGFALFIGRLLQLARTARSDFESLVVIGIGTMVMFQVVVNIFMTIGLGPITGIPLPFLSYGRSAMIVNFLCLGLCLSVIQSSRAPLTGRW